ncbi:PIN domain-containing protein [archaeon]|nr:PIN domain-containing protein [archaeon]
MTSNYILDSYAWIEYFRGSKKGEIVNRFIQNEKCFTPSIVIAELADLYSKKKYGFLQGDIDFIKANSSVLVLDAEIALNSGKIKQRIRKKYKNNFGLADAIMLATARAAGAIVLTGDHHFKKLKNIEYLG